MEYNAQEYSRLDSILKGSKYRLNLFRHEEVQALEERVIEEGGKVEPDYLALVLNSIICKSQIDRLSGGAIIAHLKPSDAMAMTIPVLEDDIQTEICSLIVQSRQEREESKRLLETAKRAVEIAIEEDEAAAFRFIEMEAK